MFLFLYFSQSHPAGWRAGYLLFLNLVSGCSLCPSDYLVWLKAHKTHKNRSAVL